MLVNIPVALRKIEVIHGRSITYFSQRNAGHFDVITQNGEYACYALFNAIKEYMDCVLEKNRPNLKPKEITAIENYISAINNILADIGNFNGQKYINTNNLSMAQGMWAGIWKKRRSLNSTYVSPCVYDYIDNHDKLLFA